MDERAYFRKIMVREKKIRAHWGDRSDMLCCIHTLLCSRARKVSDCACFFGFPSDLLTGRHDASIRLGAQGKWLKIHSYGLSG
jgi:hypothetical protein